MIGKLTGIVDSIGEDSVVIDVNGVGYLVNCPVRVVIGLPAKGESVSLSIETYVREDQIRLFGFNSHIEREWFRLLMTVQGVGAKVALAVLGVVNPTELANAIALSDKDIITRVPGVGKRVAERILTELKDKAPKYSDADDDAIKLATELSENSANQSVADAISALVNLGYQQAHARVAVAAAHRGADEGESAETLIRLALKELAK